MNNLFLLSPLWLLWTLGFFCAYLSTRYLVRYALNHQLLDHPNERSSHKLPTPRGGGLAIVSTFIVLLVVLTAVNYISVRDMLAFVGAGALVAAIGWWDDRHQVSIKIRLAVHFLAAVWAMYWLGIIDEYTSLPAIVQVSLAIVTLIYLVWMLNLYNFMDGINGIASVQAITGGIAFTLVASVIGAADKSSVIALALVAPTLGFLRWNFPRARIFMGDVGSATLGLMLGLLSLHAGLLKPELFWSWLILLGVFIVDASYTLMIRILRKEKFYEAHCSHAYQQAARRFNSHVPVTLGCALINIVWLMPVALLVALEILSPLTGILLAYLPLVLLVIYFRAGQSEPSE